MKASPIQIFRLISHPEHTSTACNLHLKESRIHSGHVAARARAPVMSGKNPNPFQHPEIQPNYLAAETDRRVILSAIKICRRLAQTDALRPFVSEETFPGAACKTDDELLNSAREIGQSIYHLMGTCRMGRREDQSSVVDEKLRVHGIKNLRVIDASIMPTMVSANLNAAAMMIAERVQTWS